MGSVRVVKVVAVISVAVFAAICLYGLTHARSYAESITIAEGADDFEELSERFTELAERKGAEYAFEVLRRAELPPQTDLHLLGHIVGDELYDQRGIDGIAICTQEFRNACSHSIVIGTLNEYGGEPALEMIRDACKKAPGGGGAYTMCYHGLGHGVFAFYGYDLAHTIAFCEKTGSDAYHDREYFECVGGAVMELMGGGGHDRDKWLASRERYLDAAEPLAPCMGAEMPDDVRTLCLIYLTPRLWELAGIDLGRPDPALFPKAFSYCDVIPSSVQELRDACFGGFGKEFVPLAGARDIRRVDQLSDNVYEEAIGWCGLAPAQDGRAACIADAVASVFWGGENDAEASFRFCHLVDDEGMRRACFLRLAGDVGAYTRGDTRERLCDQIPAAQRGACTREAAI